MTRGNFVIEASLNTLDVKGLTHCVIYQQAKKQFLSVKRNAVRE